MVFMVGGDDFDDDEADELDVQSFTRCIWLHKTWLPRNYNIEKTMAQLIHFFIYTIAKQKHNSMQKDWDKQNTQTLYTFCINTITKVKEHETRISNNQMFRFENTKLLN